MQRKQVEVGSHVFVDQMPGGSYFTKVSGVVESISNGFASIDTDAVKSKFSGDWKAHQCRVGAALDMCRVS